MRSKSVLHILAFVVVVGIAPVSHASLSCNVTKVFDRDEIKNDASFWEDLGRLSEKGELTDAKVEELFKKRSIQVRYDDPPMAKSAAQAARRVEAPRYAISHQAQKEISILPGALRKDLDDFLEIAHGGKASLPSLRAQQGRWQLKNLDGKDKDIYSVRLNGAYRVGFKILDDNSLQIIGVNKRIGH